MNAIDDEITRAQRARIANPYLDTKQAAHYLGLSVRSLAGMRGLGKGPAYRRHARFVRYHIDDLIAWSDTTRWQTLHVSSHG